MFLFKSRFHAIVSCAFLLAFAVSIGGAKCSRSLSLPQSGPTAMVMTVPAGDKVAETGRAAIWKFVPKGFQTPTRAYRILTLDKVALPKKSAADTSREANYPIPWGITGYTCFIGHDGSDPAAPTTIYLRNNLGQIEAAETALHEFGHVVYWEMAQGSDRYTWGLVWQAAREAGTLPDAYAGTSAPEGFAECFAWWTAGKLKNGPLRVFFDSLKPP